MLIGAVPALAQSDVTSFEPTSIKGELKRPRLMLPPRAPTPKKRSMIRGRASFKRQILSSAYRL